MHGQKVGHVNKEAAAKLAPLLDNSRLPLTCEASIPGRGDQWKLPLLVEFYSVAPSEAESHRAADYVSSAIHNKFRGHNFQWAYPFLKSSNGSKVKGDTLKVHSKVISWETQAQDLDAMFEKQCQDQIKNLPSLPKPPQLRSHVHLFSHQTIGIRWLVHQETSPRPIPFFTKVKEKGRTIWNCDITKCSQSERPSPIRGGILADEMGLGKTLQVIGCILMAPPKGKVYGAEDCSKNDMQAAKANDDTCTSSASTTTISIPDEAMIHSFTSVKLKSVLKSAGMIVSGTKKNRLDRVLKGIQSGLIKGDNFVDVIHDNVPDVVSLSTSIDPLPHSDNCGCTLIVCPVSVMSNWQHQINTHVKENTLKAVLYQGPDRYNLLSDVQGGSVDVLIVSYDTLTADYGKTGTGVTSSQGEDHRIDEPLKKRQKLGFSIMDLCFHRIGECIISILRCS